MNHHSALEEPKSGSPNQLIEKYQIGKVIGCGQYSFVKKCSHNSRVYAMKIIQKKSENDDVCQTELNALSILKTNPSHPNILQFYESFYGPEGFYIVTEYVQSDLFEFLANYHDILDMNICGLIISEIATGLDFMKTHHLVHGDLKPENILIDITKEKLVVKLCDFGTCQYCIPGELLSSVYVGTSGFHSPEVWLTPDSYCPYASDIFSLGCIALEIILQEVDFLMKWMPNYDYRENFDLFQSRLSNSILEVQELIQESFTFPATNKYSTPVSHPSTELFQSMIDFDPSKRPNLAEIRNCKLCKTSSHMQAIRNLNNQEKVWIRRQSDSIKSAPSNLPAIPPIKSMEEINFPNKLLKANTMNLLTTSTTSSPFHELQTNSCELNFLEVNFLVDDNVPITEALFESPTSRSITNWAISQHQKCKHQYNYFKNFIVFLLLFFILLLVRLHHLKRICRQ